MQKEAFIYFLKQVYPTRFDNLIKNFEIYYEWLIKENSNINLISRQTNPNDIWTHHFLDSLLSVRYIDFSRKQVLDFGTGGGFPGIPLAIIYHESKFTLLDSRKKKIQSVKSAAQTLNLQNCSFLDIRIEDIAKTMHGTFDIIVTRSVRILPEFHKPLINLLKPNGKLVLYKSRILDDVVLFKNYEIHDVSTPQIGERKIVIIEKRNV